MNLRFLSMIMVLSLGQAWCTNEPPVNKGPLKQSGAAKRRSGKKVPLSEPAKDPSVKGSANMDSTAESKPLVQKYTVAENSLLRLVRVLFSDDYDPQALFAVGGLLHAKLYGKSGEVKERVTEKKKKQDIEIYTQEDTRALLDAIKQSQEPTFELTLPQLVSLAVLSWNTSATVSYKWPEKIKIIAQEKEIAAKYQFFIKDGRIVACGALYPLSRYIPSEEDRKCFLKPLRRLPESLLAHPVAGAAQQAQDTQQPSLCDKLLSVLSTSEFPLWRDALPSLGMQHFGSMAPQKLPLRNHIRLLPLNEVHKKIKDLRAKLVPGRGSSLGENPEGEVIFEEALTLAELVSLAYYAAYSNEEWPSLVNMVSYDNPHKKQVIMPADLPQCYTMTVNALGKVSINPK